MIFSSPKQEITDCWEEMARQIKTFKRKFKKVEMLAPPEEEEEEKEVEEQPISFYETTNEFIQKSWESSNPPDHKDLLRNLLLMIAKDRFTPISSEFGKICSLVREWMPMGMVKDMFAQNNSGMLYFQFQIKDIN